MASTATLWPLVARRVAVPANFEEGSVRSESLGIDRPVSSDSVVDSKERFAEVQIQPVDAMIW